MLNSLVGWSTQLDTAGSSWGNLDCINAWKWKRLKQLTREWQSGKDCQSIQMMNGQTSYWLMGAWLQCTMKMQHLQWHVRDQVQKRCFNVLTQHCRAWSHVIYRSKHTVYCFCCISGLMFSSYQTVKIGKTIPSSFNPGIFFTFKINTWTLMQMQKFCKPER